MDKKWFIEEADKLITGELRTKMTGRMKSSLSGFLRVCLAAALVILQILIILFLPFLFGNLTVYFYVLWEILSVIAILNLVNSNQSPTYRMAWLSIVLVLPVSGYIMYALWGRRTKKQDVYIMHRLDEGKQYESKNAEFEKEFEEKNPLAGMMSHYLSCEGFPLYGKNHVDYFSMGEDAFEVLFADLEQAKKFIFIEFFIVAEGAIWDRLHRILQKKIAEGVEVKFLYDDFGAALRTDKDFQKNLEAEGMQVRVFNPIWRYTDRLYANFRTHQKIVVIDGEVGYTGGFNIADEYANLVQRFGEWKDTGVRVAGEAVWGLTVAFLQMWCATVVSNETIDYLKYKADIPYDVGDVNCHVLTDGPANNPSNPIESIYNQMIMYAGKYLYISTPYLVLEDYMKQSLIEAVKRGVDVRIVTPFIPDKKSVKWLTNYNYGALLRNGVRIYEYEPGFIHAKNILTDVASIVGTINMDYRSFYLHYENGIWMQGGDVGERIRQDFLHTFEECVEITYEDWERRPLRMRIVQPFLNLFSTLM